MFDICHRSSCIFWFFSHIFFLYSLIWEFCWIQSAVSEHWRSNWHNWFVDGAYKCYFGLFFGFLWKIQFSRNMFEYFETLVIVAINCETADFCLTPRKKHFFSYESDLMSTFVYAGFFESESMNKDSVSCLALKIVFVEFSSSIALNAFNFRKRNNVQQRVKRREREKQQKRKDIRNSEIGVEWCTEIHKTEEGTTERKQNLQLYYDYLEMVLILLDFRHRIFTVILCIVLECSFFAIASILTSGSVSWLHVNEDNPLSYCVSNETLAHECVTKSNVNLWIYYR